MYKYGSVKYDSDSLVEEKKGGDGLVKKMAQHAKDESIGKINANIKKGAARKGAEAAASVNGLVDKMMFRASPKPYMNWFLKQLAGTKKKLVKESLEWEESDFLDDAYLIEEGFIGDTIGEFTGAFKDATIGAAGEAIENKAKAAISGAIMNAPIFKGNALTAFAEDLGSKFAQSSDKDIGLGTRGRIQTLKELLDQETHTEPLKEDYDDSSKTDEENKADYKEALEKYNSGEGDKNKKLSGAVKTMKKGGRQGSTRRLVQSTLIALFKEKTVSELSWGKATKEVISKEKINIDNIKSLINGLGIEPTEKTKSTAGIMLNTKIINGISKIYNDTPNHTPEYKMLASSINQLFGIKIVNAAVEKKMEKSKQIKELKELNIEKSKAIQCLVYAFAIAFFSNKVVSQPIWIRESKLHLRTNNTKAGTSETPTDTSSSSPEATEAPEESEGDAVS